MRINGLDTPHWQEDVRVCVAGGADGIRIAKCESAQDVKTVEAAVTAAEEEFSAWSRAAPSSWPPWRVLGAFSMPTRSAPPRSGCSAWPSPGATCGSVSRPSPTRDGVDMLAARGQVVLAARAAGIQCFDTVFTDLDDQEGFEAEVLQNKAMGFDGKSLINPKQIRFVHQVFAPSQKEIIQAEKILRAYREQSAAGVGVFTVDGKMIDVAFIPGAERTLKLARACGMYDGEV